MTVEAELLQQAARLRVHNKGGRRAPHKPLLVLSAVSALQQTGKVRLPWSGWDERLGDLLVEYGSSGRANTHYPFRHLIEDGLWQVEGMSTFEERSFVRTKRGTVRDFKLTFLRSEDPSAGLPVQMAQRLLHSPTLQAQLVRLLLQVHFPPTIWQDVIDDAGLNHDLAEIVSFPGEVVSALAGRPGRSPAFASAVLDADKGRCVVCQYDGQDVSGGDMRPVGLDAAHVQWWTHKGPDSLDNGVTLCALHHRLLDRGMIGFDPDSRVLRTSPFFATSAPTPFVFADALAPTRLDTGYLKWQIRNVFKAA